MNYVEKMRNKRKKAFEGSHIVLTIMQLIELAKSGNLVPSPIQRNYVTKMGSEIIANIFLGIGVGTITINKTHRRKNKKPIYEVIDGWQRICSMILFFMGITQNDLDKGAVDKGLSLFCKRYGLTTYKRPLVVRFKDDLSWLSQEEQHFYGYLDKKDYASIYSCEKEIAESAINSEIDIHLCNNLSLQEQLVLFIAMNKGVTPLKNMEIYKGTVPVDVWEKLSDLGRQFAIAGAKRYTKEALAGQLFSIYTGDYKEQSTWMDSFIEVAAVSPEKNKKKWEKEFKKFENLFEEFSSSRLLALASHSIAIKNGAVSVKENASNKIDIFQVKLLFAAFVENKEIFSDAKVNEMMFTGFVEGLMKNNDKALIWADCKSNGTGSIRNFERAYSLIQSYFSKERGELALAAFTKEEE